LKGINHFHPKNEATIGIPLGFIGMVINIFIPREGREELMPFFCMGYSACAMELIK